MSRLRRLVLADRFFFVTCRLAPGRHTLDESELNILMAVIGERRKAYGFLITAWVLLPNHWHAIVYPYHPLTISGLMHGIKASSASRINKGRNEAGCLWQPRFFDRALRTVKEYHEACAYIHRNPVKAGLVARAEDWMWSSAREYSGGLNAAPQVASSLRIDRFLLPADERTRI